MPQPWHLSSRQPRHPSRQTQHRHDRHRRNVRLNYPLLCELSAFDRSFGRQGLSNPLATGCSVNNYARPEGQNVGNFVTDRSSSRVLAPPGGKSSVHFFGQTTPSKAVEDRTRRSMSPPAVQPPAVTEVRPAGPVVRQGLSLADNDYPTQTEPVGERRSSNNYSRPGNRQNVGNYITGRNTSRVLAPPGGGSNITFG